MSKFLKDLKKGQFWEQKVASYINQKNPAFSYILNDKKSLDELKKFDIIFYNDFKEITFEIKTETFPSDNIFLEHTHNGQASGIRATTATYYCLLYPNHSKSLIFKVSDFQKMLENVRNYMIKYNQLRLKDLDRYEYKAFFLNKIGGDNDKSIGYLFDLEIFERVNKEYIQHIVSFDLN